MGSGLRFIAVALVVLMDTAPLQAEDIGPWRERIAAAHGLAHNDAKSAYAEAQRLERTLPTTAAAADRVRLLNLQARVETFLSMTENAVRHAESGRDLAMQNQDKIGELEANLILAMNYVNQGRIDDLVAISTRSMTILEGVERAELVVEAMTRMATTYGRIGDFDSSITLPMQAMDIAERSGNPLALAYAHQSMAIAVGQTNRLADGLDHYKRMYEAARRASSKLLENVASLGIANALTEMGRPQEAEPTIREAVRFFRTFGGPFYLASGLTTLAYNLKRQKRQSEAAALENEIMSIYEPRGNTIGMWWILMYRSADRQAAGRIAEAAADARRAYGLANDIGTPFYKSRSGRRLADVLAAQGEFHTAFGLAAEAANMADKAAKERAGARMSELAQRYRTEAKQREIDALTRENEHQALQQRWLLTVLLGAVALLAITTFLQLRLRASHRMLATANSELQATQAQLETLNAGLEQHVQSRTAELRQQARYLRTLIDMLPMWAWFKDNRNRYLVANQAHAAAHGMTADEMVGRTDLDLVPHALALSRHADDDEVMASRGRKTVEGPGWNGADDCWMETYKAAVVDEDGVVLGTVGVTRDISERKAAETARDAALNEARRLAQLRSDFIAQMSHELRTPLNGILGYVQVLQQNDTLDEHQRSCVAVIQQSGEQLLTLINDILDLAKIEAGKLELHPSEIDLPDFLTCVADVVRIRAEQKGIRLSCDLAADLPPAIRVDERLLRQVLLNLLSNGVKFTERGHVSLQVFRVQPDRLRFSVADTGPGIDEAHMETIFHPFEQGAGTPSRLGGTGLGLAIVRQFVRRLGGEVRIESRIGQGSRFWFDLDVPLTAAVASRSAPAAAVVGYRGPRKKILVMEDIPEARELLVEVLTPLGFEIAQAANGKTGLELVQSFKPDLCLIDAVMPSLDGYEATQRIRRLPGFERLPIIGISASAFALHRDNFLEMGADAFLAKPLDLDQLLACIGDLLAIEMTCRQGTEVPVAEPMAVPPPDEVRALHALALQGNMRDIARHAQELATRDARYRPFSEHLRQLAAGYQSKAILNFVEQYLDTETR